MREREPSPPPAFGSGSGHIQPAARRRVVLLGASNLTRGVSTVLATAQAYWGNAPEKAVRGDQAWAGAEAETNATVPTAHPAARPHPLDAMLALGHGRSFGVTTNVFGRVLSSILHCGIWKALENRPPAPLAALVTDIGNDLLYGSSIPTIAGWVEETLDRLLAHEARIVVTQLPVKNSLAISETRFRVFRAVMFPSCPFSLTQVRQRADDLNERVIALCASRDIPTVEQRTNWYGWDPIHIRLKHWRQAWGEILSPWIASPQAPNIVPPPRRRWFYLRSLAPEERLWLGREQRRAQPAGKLADGTTISLY